MYKFNKSEKVYCCPMGTHRGNGVIECYWYNLVTLEDCARCEVRKDKKSIKK